jgi:hypothetical protein
MGVGEITEAVGNRALLDLLLLKIMHLIFNVTLDLSKFPPSNVEAAECFIGLYFNLS